MSKLNRRDTLRLIALSPVAAASGLAGCRPGPAGEHEHGTGSAQEALLKDGRRHEPPMFFTEPEYATVTRLVDFILPADGVSGSASDAGVPAFIDFWALDVDEPEPLQVQLRGGLAWLDLQCNRRFGHPFVGCEEAQCIEMLDLIAYPDDFEPGLEPGVAFFTLMRDLTASGFFTTEMGMGDIGYVGNRAMSSWEGVPQEVLNHVGVSYESWEGAV